MAFDQSVITDGPNVTLDGFDLRIRWASSAPEGTTFQVYVNGVLAWSGTQRACSIVRPGAFARIDVGAVLMGEGSVGLGASLPSLGGTPRRAKLTWSGGTYLDGAIEKFHVYGEPTPGGGINYATPAGVVTAYGPNVTDGWGMGGWGEGGWGTGSAYYSWTSPPLYSGTWNWAIKAVDTAGNESSAVLLSSAVQAAPRPPAPDSAGRMLTYMYNSVTGVATLSWLASPPG